MNLDQQAGALADLGVDIFYILPFDQEMEHLSDRDFARKVLHDGLGVSHVSVGFDISFGKGLYRQPPIHERLWRRNGLWGFHRPACGACRLEIFLHLGQDRPAGRPAR